MNISQESVTKYMSFLQEKKSALHNQLGAFIRLVAHQGAKREKRKEVAEGVLQANEILAGSLSQGERPPWIMPLRGTLTKFLKDDNASAVILDLVQLYNQVGGFRWHVISPESDGVNFDAMFEEIRDGSRLPALFSKITELLDEIIASGQIDSRLIQQELERLLATVKAHKTASYFSLYGITSFVKRFFTNLMWETLESIPVIAPLAKALRKTTEELQTEFDDVTQQVDHRIEVILGTNSGPLRAALLSIQEYNRQLLEPRKQLTEPDEKDSTNEEN